MCNLGHINLNAFVKNGNIDYEDLRYVVCNAVRFLDNVIDITPYFFKENESVQKTERRIGLGTMGLADLLLKLKIRYGSKESIKLCDELYQFIALEAYKSSIDLAEEKGSFMKFDFNKHFLENPNSLAAYIYFLLPHEYKEKAKKYGIRNATLLTQAPTGSTSLLAGTSSGIEPIFAFELERKDRLGKHIIRHPLYEEFVSQNKKIPYYFVTAQEITVNEHIDMQAVIQKWVDSSISKTINAPNNDTVEDVKKAYILAYEKGCKGITYFRDGSRNEQVLTSSNSNKSNNKLTRGYVLPALIETKGYRIRLTTGCGHIWLMVFTDKNNNIIETFVNTGSKGGCTISTQAMSRLVSLALRGGIALENVVDQLESAGTCPAYQFAKGKGIKVSSGRSCPSAIAKALVKLQKKLNKGEKVAEINYINEVDVENKCPECGEELMLAEGCQTCFNCGYSKCN